MKLRHPNVVQFLGAVTRKPLMLVTEYLGAVSTLIDHDHDHDHAPHTIMTPINTCTMHHVP